MDSSAEIKIATRAVIALVMIVGFMAGCTAFNEHQYGLTDRACIAQGLTENCEKPR